MIINLEPDILECEFKWALRGITMNKATGDDGIPVKLFKILKMMLLKCCTQYASKFGKPSNGHRTGKGQSSYKYPRRAVLKNFKLLDNCTHFPGLLRLRLKSVKLGFSST